MMTLVDTIRQDAGQLKARFHLRRIGIFGSYARGEETPDSDLDILVEFEPEPETFNNYTDLMFYLEDRFGKHVDVVTVEALKPQLHEIILSEVSYA